MKRLLVPLCAAFFSAAGVGGSGASATEDFSKYMYRVENSAHLLVFGNAEYEVLDGSEGQALQNIPSVRGDVKAVVEHFAEISSWPYRINGLPAQQAIDDLIEGKKPRDLNMSHFELRVGDWQDRLDAYLEHVKPGDLIVLYFSGHGFSLNGNFYMSAPNMETRPQLHLTGFYAVSLASMLDVIRARQPGAIVGLIDACRTVPDFEPSGPPQEVASFSKAPAVTMDGRARWTADSQPGGKRAYERYQSSPYIVFPVQHTATAFGSSNPSGISPFTRHLLRLVTTPKFDVQTAIQEMRNERDRGNLPDGESWIDPMTVPQRDRLIFLNRQTSAQNEEQTWSLILQSQSKEAVQDFFLENPLSPFIDAAWYWLQQDRPEPGSTWSDSTALHAAGEQNDGQQVAMMVNLSTIKKRRIGHVSTTTLNANFDERSLGVFRGNNDSEIRAAARDYFGDARLVNAQAALLKKQIGNVFIHTSRTSLANATRAPDVIDAPRIGVGTPTLEENETVVLRDVRPGPSGTLQLDISPVPDFLASNMKELDGFLNDPNAAIRIASGPSPALVGTISPTIVDKPASEALVNYGYRLARLELPPMPQPNHMFVDAGELEAFLQTASPDRFLRVVIATRRPPEDAGAERDSSLVETTRMLSARRAFIEKGVATNKISTVTVFEEGNTNSTVVTVFGLK